MISLTVYALVIALAFMGSAAAVTWGARAVGSNRALFRRGLAATGKIAVVELVLASLTLALSSPPSLLTVLAALVAFTGSIAAQWMILRRSFALTRLQNWAPFGARLVAGLVLGAFVVGVVRPYVAEAFVLPTASMSPGIEPGDRFLAEKLIRSPRRWDAIVYRVSPQVAGSAPMRGPVKWCKRVVGLPGDRLLFKDDALYVNGVVVAPGVPILGQYRLAEPRFSGGIYNDGETIQLGPDEYFVIGDNVDRSADSRHHGPVKRSDVVGIVDLRYWPLGRAEMLR
jgi:signal peptidase I